jgi:hypothetical protein
LQLFYFYVHVVKRSLRGEFYECSCLVGAKKQACKHATMVMCLRQVNILQFPPDATAEILEPARKRGRPHKSQIQNHFAIN